jgi:hypothetical protein
MPVMSARTIEILRSIEKSKAPIDAAIVEMHETVIMTRARIEQTRAWLRELDRRFPIASASVGHLSEKEQREA